MTVLTNMNTIGEHPMMFTGAAGPLEAMLTVPAQPHPFFLALLGHPHSLQGGTMNNKVVTTMARAFKELNIPSIRFNFRGVGQSAGCYDAGIGESDDLITLTQLCLSEKSDTRFLLAGFSFGSYVTYRAAAQIQPDLLISIAPAVNHYNYCEFAALAAPWLIIHGDVDEVVPLDLVMQFANQHNPPIPVTRFAATSHFFHGKLVELKAELIKQITAQVLS